MSRRPVDVAFTPAVKAAQERKRSRDIYERMEMGNVIDEGLATASAKGQPYIQHRGGPPGFLHVVGERQLGFADFKGNRQFISTGNLAENPKAFIFLMDYAHRQRIKFWGNARVVEGDAELEKRLMPEGYRARPEQVILFDVEAWDANCPQHIPQMFLAQDVAQAIEQRDGKIAELEQEIAALRAAE